MFIRWQNYRSVALWHRGKPPITRVKAILVETVRIDGKPRQKHVAFIASYEANKLDQISTRSTFWRDARQRLDRISDQITANRPQQGRSRTRTVRTDDGGSRVEVMTVMR
jgi:hypothetical protein